MSKTVLVLLTATATACSKIVKISNPAFVMSLVALALVTAAALPLSIPNSISTMTITTTTTRANNVLTSCFFSNHRFAAPSTLSFPLPKMRRVSVAGPLLSSSNTHSSHAKSFSSNLNNITTANKANNGNRIQEQPAILSAESYTNHWDNLLLEEHRLALSEWRDSRRQCSLQALENRGLTISRAFALPDSEVLGEKTVRIHSGIGGSKNINVDGILETGDAMSMSMSMMVNGKSDRGIDDLGDKDSIGKTKSSGRGRFRRPWNELFSKGDILEMTANGSDGLDSVIGRGGFSSQAFRRECLVMDVGDSWMLVGVGKTWPFGVWDARKGLRSTRGNKMNGKRTRTGGDPSYGYPIRLDKTPNAAALIPLRAQRSALQTIREQKQNPGRPMMVATWLTKTTKDYCKGYYQVRNKKRWAKNSPQHFRNIITHKNGDMKNDGEEEDEHLLGTCLEEAIEQVTKRRSLIALPSSKMQNWSSTANESQREAVVWALSRRVSSIQGPPGTGKTRVAALLIATALEMAQNNSTSASATTATTNRNHSVVDQQHPFRVLAVAHSNGAADVLLEALLELGVPAVRAGRPAAISASVRHRSVVALAEKIPQVVRLRERLVASTSSTRDINSRSNIEWELQQCIEHAQDALIDSAPVVVTSCIGAHQLSVRRDKLRGRESQRRQQHEQNQQDSGITNDMTDNDVRFPLVVLDEAAQCTEPALICALVAARAEQLVMVGDTKQLPPTVASSSKALRESLGTSPMERLEKCGLVEQKTLRIQYRMVQALLDHPSKYFYSGLVKSAVDPVTKQGTLNHSPITRAFAPIEEDPPAGFAWPNPSLPLAFVGVGRGGAEVLHDSSMGLAGRSNPSEAKLVAQIVADILEEGELKSSQICVLTPYSKQVSAIRLTLEKEALIRRHRKTNVDQSKNSDLVSNDALLTSTTATSMLRSINDVRVGTVDSFQGQEKEVVVFSAVRSNSFSELGFLRDQRRLCVALTRARKGLIILGDSTVLNSCRHWRSLIESCRDRNCFINEEHLSLQPSSRRVVSDGGSCNSELDETCEDNTTFSENSNGKNNKIIEREKLLKPDEEFLGLF